MIATRKGVNVLERGGQVHFMAAFQRLVATPPSPKLDLFGRLDPSNASEAELWASRLLREGQRADSHTPPYYTDNLMHHSRSERIFKPVLINVRMASADAPSRPRRRSKTGRLLRAL